MSGSRTNELDQRLCSAPLTRPVTAAVPPGFVKGKALV